MIETRDLRRTFKSRKSEVEAVRGVDLSVGAGEIFGFLGPNGAGKTTTLRMLATLLTPTSGEATVAGADLRREPQAGPRADRLRPAGRFDRSGRDRTRRARPPVPALRHEQVRCPGARRRGAGGPRPRSGRRSHDEHLLGRDEAPARRRARHRPQAVRPVPRRADDRSRPAGTRADVGRDPPPARGRHDRLPDHALPRGGRRAGRPAGDHRPGEDRRRGHRRRAQAHRSPATS